MSTSVENAAVWFEKRAKDTPMPGARDMYEIAAAALREKAEREAEPQTNADRIRAMTDEELAEELYNGFDVEYCSNAPECGTMLDTGEGIPESRCKSCLLEWLQQPAENEKEAVE